MAKTIELDILTILKAVKKCLCRIFIASFCAGQLVMLSWTVRLELDQNQACSSSSLKLLIQTVT